MLLRPQVCCGNLMSTVLRFVLERVASDWLQHGRQTLGPKAGIRTPRKQGQPARTAVVEVRWAQVTIEAPAGGHKKGWPSLQLWAVWVHEPCPP
jgi:hypothetical protein